MRQVICTEPIEGFLTGGLIYDVISERPEEGRLVLIDDRGLEGWFKESRFSPILTPKGSPDFSETQYIRSDEKITQCPVVERFLKRTGPEIKIDPNLGPDEWHLVFGDYRNLDNGLAQKHPWGGGSNTTSTFLVVRKDVADQLQRKVDLLTARLKYDVSELKELIECERSLKDPVNSVYYKKIIEEIESVLKQVQS